MQPGAMAKPTNHQPKAGAAPDTKGKHRIAVELKRLESEIQYLQEDLENLETTETVSAVLEETIGPVDPSWDQWFEGPQNLHGHRCWIL
ncbi:hypothetical protein DsansV1_C13g0123201 [Dioscorea sansibarensis]